MQPTDTDNTPHMDIQPASHLPQNPTRSQLLERYWFEFLQFLVNAHHDEAKYMSNMIEAHDHEYAFWNWYIERKMNFSNPNPPESR